jgi:thiamine-phosphate pyrophosphorylase
MCTSSRRNYNNPKKARFDRIALFLITTKIRIMLILLTSPEHQPNEAALLNRMLENHPELIAHLRKPAMDKRSYEKALGGINQRFHPQIVIHQHHDLMDFYAIRGVHFTENDRNIRTRHSNVISTSFHHLIDAQTIGMTYDYFFCSPVFPSISKVDYEPAENWDISNGSDAFREKAVALGGINLSGIEKAQELGFRHFAVLGSVWQSENPEKVLNELFQLVQ